MRYIFQGRHFLQLRVEELKTLSQIEESIYSYMWRYNTTVRPLSMSVMVMVFCSVYHEYSPAYLAQMANLNVKTVYTLLSKGERRCLKGKRIKYLSGVM